MKRTLALTLVVLCSGVPAFAQGPIMKSATKVVEERLQAQQPGAAGLNRNLMIGAALIAAGTTMIVLGATVANCDPSFFGDVCVGETNKGLTYSGAAMVGVGGLLIGLSYLQNVVHVGPLPRGVVVKRTVTF